MGKISDYTRVLAAKLADVFVCDQTDNGTTTTKSATVEQIGTAIGTLQNFADLDTSNKTLVDSINEIAAYTPVYGNTASGSIATFDTSLALPLQDCTIDINAVQEAGTPTPSSPKLISGFTGANIAVYNENLFTSMATFSNDGITTSYDNTTGYISIRNDSRTTNYVTGSTREHVATGLNSSHTYKYAIFPNVTGVVIANGSDVLSKDGFTGYTTVSLRITKDYDFVNDYPIGSVTKVRLVLYDVTTGVLNTYPITWQDEAGTVYGGSLDVTSGVLTVTMIGHVFDGTENFISLEGGAVFAYNFGSKVRSSYQQTNSLNTHFTNNTAGNTWANVATDCYLIAGDYYVGVNPNMSLADYKTWLGTQNTNGTPVKAVATLQTPETYQLTPTQINTILGTNNVFTDTNGNTSVMYACSLKDYIDNQ